jgi:hypothetical protein
LLEIGHLAALRVAVFRRVLHRARVHHGNSAGSRTIRSPSGTKLVTAMKMIGT